MARTDEALYTGMSSASFARVKEKKAEVNEKKTAERGVLQKDDHVILTRLQGEIDAIPRKIFDLAVSDSAETHKSTHIALAMYEAYLITLLSEFQHILKVKSDE